MAKELAMHDQDACRKNRPVGAMLAAFFLGVGIAWAGDSDAWEQAFHFPAGSTGPLLVRDGYAYVQNGWTRGDGLLVFDVRDPVKPAFVCGIPGRGYLNLPGAFREQTFYVPASFSLMVLDAGRPESLRLTRNVLYGFPVMDAKCLAVAGNRLYLGGPVGGLRILDVSEPAAPVPAAWHPEYAGMIVYAAEGDRLVMRARSGETVLATVEGFTLAERARFKTRGSPMLIGPTLVEADGRQVQIHDLRDPAAPALATNLPAAQLLGLRTPGELVTATTNNILNIWDVSEPLRPVLRRQVGLPEDLELGPAVFWEGRLHVLDRVRVALCILDLSGEQARVLGRAPIHRNEGVFELGERHAFQAYAEGQNLTILTLPLDQPGLVDYAAQVQLGPVAKSNAFHVADVFRAGAIHRIGEFLLAGDGVVDISDPLRPRVVRPMTRAAAAIAVEGGLACLAQGDCVTLLDVSKLPEVVELGVYRAEDGARHYTDAALSDGRACVVNAAQANPRLEILDVRKPAQPQRLGVCALPSGLVCAWVGPHVYVPGVNRGHEPAGLVVVDVSDPAAPRVARVLPDLVQSACYRVRARNGRLYYTDSMRGIQVADLRDPLNPVWLKALTGPTEWSCSYTDFEIRDNRLYGQRYSHLDVWRLDAK
jgi:hypothetical protein